MQNYPAGGVFPVAEIGSTDDFANLILPPQNGQPMPAPSLSPSPQRQTTLPAPQPLPSQTAAAPAQTQTTAFFASPTTNQPLPQAPVAQRPYAVIAAPLPPNQALPAVLFNAPPPQAPQAPIKEPVPMGSPIEAGGVLIDQHSVVSGKVGTVSALLGFLSFWYLGLTALGIGLLELGNRAGSNFSPAGLPGMFLGAFPGAGLMVIGLAFFSFLFGFATIKNTEATPGGWKLGFTIGLLALVTAVFSGGAQVIALGQGVQFVSRVVETQYPGIPYAWLWLLVSFGGLVSFVSPVALLMSKREYEADPATVSAHKWTPFLLLSVLVFCVVSAYFVFHSISLIDTSYGKNNLKKVVSYHVYHAAKAPSGRVPKQLFTINTNPSALLVGRDDFVEVVYDYPYNKRAAGAQSSEITLRQIQVGQPFDLEAFSESVLPNGQMAPLQIGSTDKQQAFGIRSTGQTPMTALAMTTKDSVLILLSSTTANMSELEALAESLQ